MFDDDETTARNYTAAASDADAILTVQADSDERAAVAQEIMDRNGSIDVDERGTQHGQQNTGTRRYASASIDTDASAGKRTIPVVEERLEVGKREVERGGARIRSRIVQKPVEERIRLAKSTSR